MFPKRLLNSDLSPKKKLISGAELESKVGKLRDLLAADSSPEVVAELKTPSANGLPRGWWQRMAVPGTNYFTTSNHDSLQITDPGFLNTLGGRLTPREGFILRPVPKWAYLEPILPQVAGKSVLEIGCNNGFFCFEFSRLGATKVTGAEVFQGFVRLARWMANERGTTNIEFLLTDALLDLTLPAHDIVFMSEVYAHFIDPLFGLLRAVNLAKETLVIDSATLTRAGYEMDLQAGLDPATGKMKYHSWVLSDGLVLAYLLLCGVPPERVTRYIAPWDNHIVYVIDTRYVAQYRKDNDFQPCNTSFINMDWKMPQIRSADHAGAEEIRSNQSRLP